MRRCDLSSRFPLFLGVGFHYIMHDVLVLFCSLGRLDYGESQNRRYKTVQCVLLLRQYELSFDATLLFILAKTNCKKTIPIESFLIIGCLKVGVYL